MDALTESVIKIGVALLRKQNLSEWSNFNDICRQKKQQNKTKKKKKLRVVLVAYATDYQPVHIINLGRTDYRPSQNSNCICYGRELAAYAIPIKWNSPIIDCRATYVFTWCT